MKQLLTVLAAAMFACTSFYAVAANHVKKPTAEQCKKDPKLKGCETKKK